MSSKKLMFRSEARDKILRGATALADAVRVTLGPRSKCVLIDRKTKVVRLALENAVSVAGTLLLTEATMTSIPEPNAEPQSKYNSE
jgi:chaperonin GroEL (HSP60 family)